MIFCQSGVKSVFCGLLNVWIDGGVDDDIVVDGFDKMWQYIYYLVGGVVVVGGCILVNYFGWCCKGVFGFVGGDVVFFVYGGQYQLCLVFCQIWVFCWGELVGGFQ